MGALRDGIETWIKANYAFRFGPRAYTADMQDVLTAAEEDLHVLVTGSASPVKAAAVLGVPVAQHRERMRKEAEARSKRGRG